MTDNVNISDVDTNGNVLKNNNEVTANNNYKQKFPFSIKPVEPSINKMLLKDFTGEKDGFVQVGPKKYVFPQTFSQHAEHFYNFKARPDDIWVATFPRSGTTWTQELVWMIANDLDYDGAQRDFLTKRSPFFEFCFFTHDETMKMFLKEQEGNPENQRMINEISIPGYQYIPDIVGQRFIKTHLPFSLMPPSVMNENCKTVYVARNPKDVVVSLYYLSRLYRGIGYVEDFETFWNYFENSLVAYSPFWEHIKEGWEHRHDPNVLFMFYEDMNQNLPATIQKVANFLNKSMTDEEVTKLADYLNIKNFRNNQAVNQHEMIDMGVMSPSEQSFVRNGKSTLNGWQKEYTSEIVNRVEKWIAEHLKDTTLRFPDYS